MRVPKISAAFPQGIESKHQGQILSPSDSSSSMILVQVISLLHTSPAHDCLQSRQTPHRGGIAPIISSRDGHKSRAAVLDIDDNHGSARPHLSAVRKLDGLTESKLF